MLVRLNDDFDGVNEANIPEVGIRPAGEGGRMQPAGGTGERHREHRSILEKTLRKFAVRLEVLRDLVCRNEGSC